LLLPPARAVLAFGLLVFSLRIPLAETVLLLSLAALLLVVLAWGLAEGWGGWRLLEGCCGCLLPPATSVMVTSRCVLVGGVVLDT